MPDTDQPTPQPAQYPGFAITAPGLERVYVEIGRLTHQAVEMRLAAEKVIAASAEREQQSNEMLAKLMAGIVPLPPESDEEPTPTRQEEAG